MSEELKPCPFCGNIKPRLIEDEHRQVFVMCHECGARGLIVLLSHDGERETAITSWNRRATAQEVMREALNAARVFIEDEYRDPSLEPEGEWLAKEARAIHSKICDALSATAEPAGRELMEEAAKGLEMCIKRLEILGVIHPVSRSGETLHNAFATLSKLRTALGEK